MTSESSRPGRRTVLITGGSRGIGLAIAVRLAREGADITLVAKTDIPDPRLPGTVHTAAAAIEEAGGRALPIVGDIRDDETVARAVEQTVARFGGIDVVINNASAITLSGFGQLTAKRYDLMHDINARATFTVTSAALPHVMKSPRPHVLTLSPPLNPDRRWLADFAPYTVSKYAMTMLTLGVAEQFRERGVAANCLWPATLIGTAAVRNVVAGEQGMRSSRRPEIMADAAAVILGRTAAEATGQCFVDENVLRDCGIDDFTPYLSDGASEENLEPDLFL